MAGSDELTGTSDEALKWDSPYVGGPGISVRQEVWVSMELAVEVS